MHDNHLKEQQPMSGLSNNAYAVFFEVAEKAVLLYVQDILTAEALVERMVQEWEQIRVEDDQPSHALLMRIAQRICSRALCVAWSSPDLEVRNRAFQNLRRHLERSLLHTRYAAILQEHANALEDVLHQALESLHLALLRSEYGGPKDPAAFLKWAQTIVIRQAHVSLQRLRRDTCLSLDTLTQMFAEQVVDQQNADPLEYVLLHEVRQTLGEAILTMKNSRYRQVLLYTFIAGVDERELAKCLQVRVQEIYVWKHRALKALRNNPEVMKTLRSLLD